MRLPRRVRYWIADVLNRRDDVCWAEAVGWVEFGGVSVTDVLGSAAMNDCTGDGLCYCGKLCDGRRSVPADFELNPNDLPEPF